MQNSFSLFLERERKRSNVMMYKTVMLFILIRLHQAIMTAFAIPN